MLRTIRTAYMLRGVVLHVNSSCDANRAVQQCIGHMQVNAYGANSAEVYSVEGANEVFVQVARRMSGRIEIDYLYDPVEYRKARYSALPLLQKKGKSK